MRKITKMTIYVCNYCKTVFKTSEDAKRHWKTSHRAIEAKMGGGEVRRRGRPRKVLKVPVP